MATCKYCNSEVAEGLNFCPACGAPVENTAAGAQAQPQPTYQQPGYQPNYNTPATPAVDDSGSIGWGVLGFLIPLVGLVLFLAWKNTKPKCAKVAGMGALISVCISIVFYVIGGAAAVMS